MEDIISRKRLAEILDVPVGTIANWAYLGTGPRYFRVGKHVRYAMKDVRSWLESNARDPKPAAR